MDADVRMLLSYSSFYFVIPILILNSLPVTFSLLCDCEPPPH